MPAALQVLAYVSQVLGLMPQLIGAGQSIMGLVTTAQTAVSNMQAENRGPNAQEIAALEALRQANDVLHAQAQAIPNA
jgi:hypothetical protein